MKKIFVLIDKDIKRIVLDGEKEICRLEATKKYGECEVVFIGDGVDEALPEVYRNAYTEFFAQWQSAISRESERQVEILDLLKKDHSLDPDSFVLNDLLLKKYHDLVLKGQANRYGVDRNTLIKEDHTLAQIDGKIRFLQESSEKWKEEDKKYKMASIGASILMILKSEATSMFTFDHFSELVSSTLKKVEILKKGSPELARGLLEKIGSSVLEILRSEGEKVAGDVLAEIGKSIEKIILSETDAGSSIVDSAFITEAVVSSDAPDTGVSAMGDTTKTAVASEE